MADVVRRIGLSLGADLCWPICFERILETLNLAMSIGDDIVRIEAERRSIEPYSLRADCPYDVVLDRVTHWFHPSREWIKKSVLMDDLYVLNNPWTLQSMEKQTSYCAMMRLGLPVPDTWMVPPKAYAASPDLQPTLERYARLFDLSQVGADLGYPQYMKPYDGGAWVGVSRINNADELRAAYEASGTSVMHLQKSVEGYDLFARCVGVGPQIRIVKYDPGAPLHQRYKTDVDFVSDEDASLLEDMTLTINGFFGWDFNSCEALRADGVFYPIDFANACPDSQVTSLHFHFPWLVKSVLKWTIYCAATKKKMRKMVDWDPYFKVADEQDMPYREKLRAYADITRERMETDRFAEFCQTHLAHVDEVTWEFFGSDAAHEAVRLKVQSLFPPHEFDEFTEYFWRLVQQWREHEAATPKSAGQTAGQAKT